ncbi:MAG TPA: DUF6152 family protein [Aquabacterium sp.]|nr:DUF6152 family protein [Aquabacterium sp.]
MLQRRPLLFFAVAALPATRALAHHGWSSFDQTRPIYLAGKVATVAWRNPHVEVHLELDADLKLPADLKARPLPAQSAPVDGPQLLAAATVPKRRDRRWEIEFAPLTRMQAWSVPEIKPGDALQVLGFTFPNEQGEPILRAEFLWLGGKAYGLRSSPA